MKIGIVTTWFERGAAYVSKQYLDALKEEHDVFVYARGGEMLAQHSDWDSSRVTWGSKKWGKDFSHEGRTANLAHFSEWLENKKPDVVFFNEEHWWEPVVLCAERGIKTGAYVDYYTRHTLPFFALYDFLICNTKRHHEAFAWHEQAYYVPWGTDTNLFRPTHQAPKPVRPGAVTFFHSAGMNPSRKGTDVLLRTFARVAAPHARLVIHSQVDLVQTFPDLAVTINDLVSRGRLECRIETVSAPGLYYLGDVYVYPTRLEGIGLTIAEALASGLPAIVPDNAPMNEFVDNDRGRLVPVTAFVRRHDDYFWPECLIDEDALVQAMEDFATLPELSSWKIAARIYAEQHLDWFKNRTALSALFVSATCMPLSAKQSIISRVRSYDAIKTSSIRRLVNKVRILKWRFVPYAFRYASKRIRTRLHF